MARIPINMQTAEAVTPPLVIGIDLGTTNSLVATVNPETGEPHVLPINNGHTILPSVVYIQDDNAAVVGEQAKKNIIAHPERTITSVKRLIGRTYKDIENRLSEYAYSIIDDQSDSLVKININNHFYTPTELSAIILSDIKKKAEKILEQVVQKAVITVPAYFNDTQRQAVRDAGKIAGLEVLRIISEPTAAGLAYGIGAKSKEQKKIAVYDLGGGTFDVSILQITDTIFEVLSTKGDTYCGGDDIDALIAEEWIKNTDIHEKNKTVAQLKSLAESAKKHLSYNESFATIWEGVSLSLNREKMNELIKPFVEKTLELCRDAMADAELTIASIDEVVLVGGSTRTPYIQEQVSRLFQQTAKHQINPDEVVALGAAVQASVLSGIKKDVLLLDVTPLSLGIETIGGIMDTLITRNTTIPSSAKRMYTTQKNGQANMRISVFQGERDLVKDNRKLSEFTLNGIPPAPAGMAKIEVTFLIDADGILTVKAQELKSGVMQQIEVMPQYGLDQKEVQRLLEDSIKYAKEDMYQRSLTEAQVEAQQILKATDQFLQKRIDTLDKKDKESLRKAMQQLEKVASGNDRNAILKAHKILDETTTSIVESCKNA